MSQAEDLLNSIIESDLTSYTARPEVEEHIVVGENRFIVVPESLKRIAVQFDHNIETVTFDCPRYWDEHDMSQMDVYINYIRSDGHKGACRCTNVIPDETDDNIMHFDWTVKEDVTFVNGALKFLVCVKKTENGTSEKVHWNSEINYDLYVAEGLEYFETIQDEYPDVIEDILNDLKNIKEANLPETTTDDDGKVLTVVNGKWAAAGLPLYDGTYEITPSANSDLTLKTSQSFIDADITVKKIPYADVSNSANGRTITIGSED